MNAEAKPSSAEVRAEAAAWVARLHSSSRTRALEEGFNRWLQASPKNAKAFELATRAWELAGSIPSGALPRMAHPEEGGRSKRRLLTAPRFGIAAALCIAAVGALYLLNADRGAVTTQVGEQRMLTLDDGSRIFLNTDTKLTVHYDADRRLVRLAEGEALFDVAKNPQRPFIVEAGDQQVRAVGTEFVVRRDPDQLAVTLVEGKVRVSDVNPSERSGSAAALGQPTDLVAGQRLILAGTRRPAVDQPTMDTVTAWRRGEVVLDKTPLKDAAREMNRYSRVKLVIEDPEAANIALSGIFRAGDSASFAQAVATTYHLQIETEPHRIVISGSRQP